MNARALEQDERRFEEILPYYSPQAVYLPNNGAWGRSGTRATVSRSSPGPDPSHQDLGLDKFGNPAHPTSFGNEINSVQSLVHVRVNLLCITPSINPPFTFLRWMWHVVNTYTNHDSPCCPLVSSPHPVGAIRATNHPAPRAPTLTKPRG